MSFLSAWPENWARKASKDDFGERVNLKQSNLSLLKDYFHTIIIYCMKQKVHEYTAVFQEEKEGGYSVWVPTLPGCASQGESIEEALTNIKEAIELYLEDEKEKIEDEDFRRQFVVPVRIYA